MSSTHETPLAESADRRWYLLAIVIFLLAVKSALSAAMVIADESYLRYLDWAEGAAAMATLPIVAWLVFFKFARVPRAQRHHFLNMEGYVRDTVRQACSASWTATVVPLMVLGAIADDWVASMPAEFFLQAAIAVMLGVFSLTFFVMNRSSDDEGVAGA